MKTSPLRGTAVTARVGMALGIAIALCFITGLISHFIQHPQPWFYWPTRPVWLYRVTQGLHVVSGIAAIPLIIVKLWSVWPKLFERPIIGGITKHPAILREIHRRETTELLRTEDLAIAFQPITDLTTGARDHSLGYLAAILGYLVIAGAMAK